MALLAKFDGDFAYGSQTYTRYRSAAVHVVISSLPGPLMARNGHAEVSWRCPLLGEQRKTFALTELFRF